MITELNQNEIIKNAIGKSINEDKYTSMILHFEGDSIISKMDIIKKYDSNKNIFAKILMILAIIGIYVFIPFDYEVYLPLFIVMLYFTIIYLESKCTLKPGLN